MFYFETASDITLLDLIFKKEDKELSLGFTFLFFTLDGEKLLLFQVKQRHLSPSLLAQHPLNLEFAHHYHQQPTRSQMVRIWT